MQQATGLTPVIPASPFVGIPAPAQISNLQTVVQNAGLGVTAAYPSAMTGNTSASLPATSADIERLIEAVRLQSISTHSQQLPSANSSLAAILAAQQQLQAQNQASNMYDIRSRSVAASPYTTGSLYSFGVPASHIHAAGMPLEYAPPQSYASAAAIHQDGRSSCSVNADLARLRSTQTSDKRTTAPMRKAPSLPRYVPPQARGDASQGYGQAHSSDSLRRP